MRFFIPLSMAFGLVAADTCFFELNFRRSQNPFGGDNTLSCGAIVYYGDGSSEVITDDCSQVTATRCYNTLLPNAFCVTTNSKLEDGFIDYGAQHSDFSSDFCAVEKGATAIGDGTKTTCSFDC